ncbi:sensor histidine kinase [Geotalea daltonii FRC-32]|uniref:histidine kinase n=1 Tax=Geotalea daltonii (strain DSM 22248 / JCM 15807 / FRC-32) TaxID=316067 RepID=B9M7L2_GEODF|nr:ATP-binding protein [Geotalea daltonii]ACM22118.1 sensor histidine kinase [Geotalea daltonii FRC-32]
MTSGQDHPDEKLIADYSPYREEILAEQVKQIYALAPIGFIATFFNSVIVFFLMKDVMEFRLLVLWGVTLLSITALRLGLVLRFRNVKQHLNFAATWRRRFVVSLFIAGAAWGWIGFFPFGEITIAHQVFIAFVLGGMTAGASSTFSMIKEGYAVFSIPALTPLAIHFFLMKDVFHCAMGTMLVLFGVLLWRISIHNYRVNRTSLLLRFENKGMIERLKQAKERVEGLNDRLSAEVEAKHRAEADLRAHHDQLERAVTERTADLTTLNKELEQFAYVASHDLQEPLRMVISYLQLLKQKYHGQLDEKADMYIGFAVDGGIRMQRLIEGLLSYSRLSRGAEFTRVDINGIFAAAVANLAGVIEESGAEVTRAHLPTVIGDELQLQQLLQNLISNGLKYRKPERRPTVHVSAERQGEEWLFSVRDNGIGIDPNHFDKIFQIFQRLHTSEEYPGTGIGLALCQKIIERHGGAIWVESTFGEGSTFSFTIPVHGASGASSHMDSS